MYEDLVYISCVLLSSYCLVATVTLHPTILFPNGLVDSHISDSKCQPQKHKLCRLSNDHIYSTTCHLVPQLSR